MLVFAGVGLSIMVNKRLHESEASGEMKDGIAALEADFAAYRENYRTLRAAAAAGEKIGDPILPAGREYHDAVISKVTAVGIEIRHEHGYRPHPAPAPRRPGAADPEEIRTARELLAGWHAKVSRVAIEKSAADCQAVAGRESVVPGSLETWRVRSRRLAGDLTRARRPRRRPRAPGDPRTRRLVAPGAARW